MGRRKLDKGNNGNKEKRIAPFNKKKINAIMKKAYELSILCDVQVCVIIYGPKRGPPCVWPEEPDKHEKILARYMSIPLAERRKRALNLSTILKKSQKDQVLDVMSNDKHVENLPNFGIPWDNREQLFELAKRLDSKIEYVKYRIDMMKSWTQLRLTKLEDAQYYGGEVPSQYECQNHNFGNGHYYHPEEQRRYTEAMTTATTTMINNVGFNNLNISNNNNVNVNDYNGYIGKNMADSKPAFDPSSLTWRHPQPQPQLQLQLQSQQFYGDQQEQQPFNYEHPC